MGFLLDFFLWDFYIISMVLWGSYGISAGFLWEFYVVSMRFLPHFYGVAMGFLWDFYGISLGVLRDFNDISKKFRSRLTPIENLTYP
jgi:hypothetical protein